MLDPYGLPLGHHALCPCDACQTAREDWTNRARSLLEDLPPADAEDSTDHASIQEDLTHAAFRR